MARRGTGRAESGRVGRMEGEENITINSAQGKGVGFDNGCSEWLNRIMKMQEGDKKKEG